MRQGRKMSGECHHWSVGDDDRPEFGILQETGGDHVEKHAASTSLSCQFLIHSMEDSL
jgi:hypothetical protein